MDTLLGDPMANTTTGTEKGQKDQMGIDDIGIIEFIFHGLPEHQIPTSKPRTLTAAKNLTTQPQQHPRSLNNEIVSRQMIDEINMEWEKSDIVAKLNAVKQFNKQDHKSKLMTEKYSLLPLNPQQLTPVQTAIQRMSEKHPDFEIEPVNTI